MLNDTHAFGRLENRIVSASGKNYQANLPVEPVEMESIHGRTMISPARSADSTSMAFASTIA
jgi:hypothetical protein